MLGLLSAWKKSLHILRNNSTAYHMKQLVRKVMHYYFAWSCDLTCIQESSELQSYHTVDGKLRIVKLSFLAICRIYRLIYSNYGRYEIVCWLHNREFKSESDFELTHIRVQVTRYVTLCIVLFAKIVNHRNEYFTCSSMVLNPFYVR